MDCDTITVAVRGVHDHSGDIVGEHVDRHDGEHVSEDCGDTEWVAAPVGEDSTGGGARSASGAETQELISLQPTNG